MSVLNRAYAQHYRAERTTILSVVYLTATALLIATRGRAIPAWYALVGAHLGVCALLAWALGVSRPRVILVLCDWHPLMLFPFLYKEVELLAKAIGDWRLTAVISAVEAAVFNGQPSLYLSERFNFVALSEFLHFCYLSYVVLIPGVAAYWYFSGRRAAFDELLLLLATVMYGSYLVFILLPVDSPYYRFEPIGPPLAGHFFFDLVNRCRHAEALVVARFRVRMHLAPWCSGWSPSVINGAWRYF